MLNESVLAKVFDDQTIAVPCLTISYEVTLGGRRGRICHTVSEVIYSAFDALFARHLCATAGIVLPRARVDTAFLSEGQVSRQASSGCTTLLDALTRIGEKAEAAEVDTFLVAPGDQARHLRDLPQLAPRRYDPAHFATMRATTRLLADIADPGLCRVSATFDGVTVYLPDGSAVFAEIDLAQGLITFPAAARDAAAESIKVPLLGFAMAERSSPALRARLRLMQDGLGEARRRAVDGFSREADLEVTRLHAAMDGRPVEGHALEVARDLLDRLVAAFGTALRGLSPHARLVALDWIAAASVVRRIEQGLAA